MGVSYIHSDVAREMLNAVTKHGPEMSSAILIYVDAQGEICWCASDNVTRSDAVWQLEKVKLALLQSD